MGNTSSANKDENNNTKKLESQLIEIEKKKESKKNLKIKYEGNLNDYIIKEVTDKKVKIEQIKNIFIQFSNELLNNYLKDKNYIHGNIKIKNILYSKNNNKLKFHLIPKSEINQDQKDENDLNPPEILEGKEKYSNKIDIWNLGLLLYKLYEGKDFDYQNNYEILKNKVKEDINEKYDNDNEELKEEEVINDDKMIQNLIKGCLNIEEDKRFNFNDYFIHPFFNHIYTTNIKDNTNLNNQDKNKECLEYLNINLINLPKIFIKKLNLFCYEDDDIIFNNLNQFQKEIQNRIEKEENKDKINEIILYRLINEKDTKNLKELLIFLNSLLNDIYDLIMPFIIFLYKDNNEIKIINDILENEELKRLDKRFISFCKYSDEIYDLGIIKKHIYRAFSYYKNVVIYLI